MVHLIAAVVRDAEFGSGYRVDVKLVLLDHPCGRPHPLVSPPVRAWILHVAVIHALLRFWEVPIQHIRSRVGVSRERREGTVLRRGWRSGAVGRGGGNHMSGRNHVVLGYRN